MVLTIAIMQLCHVEVLCGTGWKCLEEIPTTLRLVLPLIARLLSRNTQNEHLKLDSESSCLNEETVNICRAMLRLTQTVSKYTALEWLNTWSALFPFSA